MISCIGLHWFIHVGPAEVQRKHAGSNMPWLHIQRWLSEPKADRHAKETKNGRALFGRPDLYYDCALTPPDCKHTSYGVECNTYRYCPANKCLIDDAANLALGAAVQIRLAKRCFAHSDSLSDRLTALPDTSARPGCLA